jgi:hypothetical protein
MTSSFSALKQSRSSSFDKLNQQLQKLDNSTSNNNNEDYWKLEVDKAGNGYAIIRFLPAPQGEDLPFVRVFDHGFQGPGGWYIENSLTTIGQDDPVSEYNSQLWNSGVDANKEIARKQKRRLSYHANIYVVKDPANPQNEGKVFKYKFGKKIFDKLNAAMNPEFEDETPLNPFDFWEGANFKLKARNGDGGYRTYEPSSFDAPSALLDDDAELEKVWQSQHSLQEIVDPKNFKSYSELKAKLYKVLALDGSHHAPTTTAEDDDTEMDFTPKFKERPAPAQSEAPSPTYDEASFSSSTSDDDDDLDFFKSLADD